MADGRNELVPSDEGDAKGLALGRKQGDALGETLRHMTEEVADDGGEVQVGEYLVAYAVEKAEGMHVMRDGTLVWQEPEEANAHVEVAVRDAADGRFIPGLEIEATLTRADGEDAGTHRLPLLWHPYLYHYGRNWTVPSGGSYRLRVRFEPPAFHRHDEKNGRRFLKGCDHTFENVKIETGQD